MSNGLPLSALALLYKHSANPFLTRRIEKLHSGCPYVVFRGAGTSGVAIIALHFIGLFLCLLSWDVLDVAHATVSRDFSPKKSTSGLHLLADASPRTNAVESQGRGARRMPIRILVVDDS